MYPNLRQFLTLILHDCLGVWAGVPETPSALEGEKGTLGVRLGLLFCSQGCKSRFWLCRGETRWFE